MNYKWGLGGAVVVALVLVGTLVWPGIGGDGNSSESTNDGPTFVVAPVERRTLRSHGTRGGESTRSSRTR